MPFDNIMKLTVHKLTIFLRKPKAEQFPITSSHQTENSFIHVRTYVRTYEHASTRVSPEKSPTFSNLYFS